MVVDRGRGAHRDWELMAGTQAGGRVDAHPTRKGMRSALHARQAYLGERKCLLPGGAWQGLG